MGGNATAENVLRTEGEALLALAGALPRDFAATVDLVLGLSGRVIVSGMGKSGHVARKIASTLASTGTPAFFVHPAEASHGDLGMITGQDACILISNSGETAELADVIAHCARFSIPLIGISKEPDSTLMRAADLRLVLPDRPEACAIGMAPTTSTVLALGLGDALAVTLMERRRFSRAQFRDIHPGGRLGARLATVAQLMHSDLPLIGEGAGMAEAILMMTARGFGLVGLVDAKGVLTGVISDGDLRRNIDGLMERRARDVCTRNPATITPDALAAEALAVMNARKIGAILAVDGAGVPVGILHLHDCLRAGVA